MKNDIEKYRHLLWIPLIICLFWISRINYLFFHGIVEIFNITIACSIFIISWNSKKITRQPHYIFIGIALLFFAFLDLTHMFSYQGLNIFSTGNANLPTQFLISARYMESITFLCAPLFLGKNISTSLIALLYGLITAFIFAAIFQWDIFPVCYIEGSGLTAFYIISQYLICTIWLLAIITFTSHRHKMIAPSYPLFLFAIILNIASELTLILSQGVNVNDIYSFASHIFNIFSIYFVYKAIIEISLTQPYNSIFRELHKSEKQFRNIYDTAPLAFVVWNKQCEIIKWNNTAEKMFGWSSQEVMGQNFFEFLVPENKRSQMKEIAESLQKGTFANRSINDNITKNGKIITCEWNNSILKDEENNIEGYLSLGLDITEQILAGKTLAQQSEMTERFAYSIVHDLKSPSTSLYGLADLLSKKYGKSLDQKARLFIDQIMNISAQITSLVENINIFIATKELPCSIETIQLKEILTLIREEFSAQLISRNIHWSEPESIPHIRADRIAVIRVLRNFIENALKYGGENLKTIQIGYEDREDYHILLVKDDGAGLKQEELGSIFEVFQRKKNPGAIIGSGLGLAIVRELARHFKGQVWVESSFGKGACFYISISKNI